jgi:hypothetical protein
VTLVEDSGVRRRPVIVYPLRVLHRLCMLRTVTRGCVDEAIAVILAVPAMDMDTV